MAAATQITKLPEVLRSPTSIQYYGYRAKVKHSKPFFKPRFTFKLEDRQHTLLATPKWRLEDPLMPPYPYGANMHFPEANFGLYGGASVHSGSKISKGRNKGKTVRHWFPNVRVETVKSEALGEELKLPITARVMRTIRKVGGLDQYVTGMKPARIKELGLLGWKLRWLVMTSRRYRAEHALQLRRNDLPKHYSLEGTFEDAWNDEDVREKMIAEQEAAWQDLRDAAKRFENHVQRQWVESGEKARYSIPKLETLKRSIPDSLGLPQRLEEPDVVEREYRQVRTFQQPISAHEVAMLSMQTLDTKASEKGEISQGLEDQMSDLTVSTNAQDLGSNPVQDDINRVR
ncbi:hypothetical protein H2200_006432 [Cladophialophora chaetospira]|uniref:54S ribosomal protein L24, mitochondrial n=1 Tax=Cladophialophora chaetospira TaxID=386627 RepID=A0AA38X871_9EURO|nr:hypothetical protein H2200_006432 [Cladophialophora chaetospira]